MLEAEHERYLIREGQHIRAHETGKAMNCRNAAAEIRKDPGTMPVLRSEYRLDNIILDGVRIITWVVAGYLIYGIIRSTF